MITDAISKFKTGTYTVTRIGASIYTAGVQSDPAETTFTIDAVEVPLTGRDEENLPEGLLASESRIFLTVTALETSSGTKPDTIIVDGEKYTVINVMRWNFKGTLFYRCLISLYQVGQL